MRALSLHQPWAYLVAAGLKSVETRSWKTDYRGPLAIHASKDRTEHIHFVEMLKREHFPEALAKCRELEHAKSSGNPLYDCRALPRGGIVAVCQLDGVVPVEDVRRDISQKEASFGWYVSGRHAWLLSDIRPVPLVKCRGRLGLWELPDDIMETALFLSRQRQQKDATNA